jgi:CheY-like chemotaxis protein
VVRGDTVARALLVEDNPVNLSVARRMLAKLGIDSVVARDGQEALQVLEQERVDLVFMDCQMPTMDGYEATRRLRAAEQDMDPPRHLPVVAMTANAMLGDREKCLEAGMDDYLAKPLEFASLRRAIEPWVRLRDGHYYSKGQGTVIGQLQVDADVRPDKLAEPASAATGQPAAAEAVVAAVDEVRLAGLRELMAEDLPRLIREYLDSVPTLLQELDQAAAAGDPEAMVRPAHTLKSSSANMCAMRLSAEAAKLEQLARAGKLESALQVQQGMAGEFAAASKVLKALLN